MLFIERIVRLIESSHFTFSVIYCSVYSPSIVHITRMWHVYPHITIML
jgi:hypothetical protein